MENKPNEPGSFTFTGDWATQSKKLKEQFSQLNDFDLKFEKGKENELLKRVQDKLNKKREEVITIINKTEGSAKAQ